MLLSNYSDPEEGVQWASRRPPGEARRGRRLLPCNRGATKRGGMDRRPLGTLFGGSCTESSSHCYVALDSIELDALLIVLASMEFGTFRARSRKVCVTIPGYFERSQRAHDPRSLRTDNLGSPRLPQPPTVSHRLSSSQAARAGADSAHGEHTSKRLATGAHLTSPPLRSNLQCSRYSLAASLRKRATLRNFTPVETSCSVPNSIDGPRSVPSDFPPLVGGNR